MKLLDFIKKFLPCYHCKNLDPKKCSIEGEYDNVARNKKIQTTVEEQTAEELMARYNIKVICDCGTKLVLLDSVKSLEENNESSKNNLRTFLRLWTENQKNTTD